MFKNQEKDCEIEPHVVCEVCKCWVDPDYAHKVKTGYGYEYYCQNDKPPYSEAYYDYGIPGVSYYARMRVNKDGSIYHEKTIQKKK